MVVINNYDNCHFRVYLPCRLSDIVRLSITFMRVKHNKTYTFIHISIPTCIDTHILNIFVIVIHTFYKHCRPSK